MGLDILIGGSLWNSTTRGRSPGIGVPAGRGENGRCINEKTAVGLMVGAHRQTLRLKVMRPEELPVSSLLKFYRPTNSSRRRTTG